MILHPDELIYNIASYALCIRWSIDAVRIERVPQIKRTFAYWRNLFLFALGLILLAAAAGMLWLAHSKALTLVHPARTQPSETPAKYGISTWEEVSFLTADNLELRGWFIPPQASVDGAAIIYVHGLGSNREDLLDQAAVLHEYGYGALLFDLRNHGESQGTVTTLGYLEADDVRAAVDYLLSRPDVNPQRIGLMGMSMGGATVLRAAARIPEVRAVVAEAAYTSIEDNLEHGVRALTGLPPFPFAPLVVWFGELESGLDIRLMRPVDDVSKIAPRPLLLVHGAEDTLVPLDNGEALYQAAGEPRQLYIVSEAGHGGFLEADPLNFEPTLVEFFRLNLGMP